MFTRNLPTIIPERIVVSLLVRVISLNLQAPSNKHLSFGESQPEEGQSSCIVDDDGGLPIIAIAGAAIAVLAIGGILMVQGNSKPAPKGKRVRRPPEDVRRQKKRPKGEQKKKPKGLQKRKTRKSDSLNYSL